MDKTCKTCRFCDKDKCAKFSININEEYVACGDYSEKVVINESMQKIKLYD